LSHIFDVAVVFAYAPVFVFAFAFARPRRWSHFYTKMLSFTPANLKVMIISVVLVLVLPDFLPLL
jgi:hypothetical protein